MHDIKEGFIQRRLPDGGFKVGLDDSVCAGVDDNSSFSISVEAI